jgi:histone H3/H4
VSTLSQYDGWTVEEIVAKNSHELTAVHVLGARAYILEARREQAEEVRRLVTQIEDVHRIGLAVMAAKRAGRKTVRIKDVTP